MMETIKNYAGKSSLVGVYSNILSTELMTVNTFELKSTAKAPTGSLSSKLMLAASLALLSGALF